MLKFERKDPKMLVNAATKAQIIENKPFISEMILISRDTPSINTLNYRMKGKLRPEMISMTIIGGNDDLNFTINNKLVIVCNRDFYYSFGITGKKADDKYVLELDTIPSKFQEIELEFIITSSSKIKDFGVEPVEVQCNTFEVETAVPKADIDFVEWMGRLVLSAEIPAEIEMAPGIHNLYVTRVNGVVHCSEITKLDKSVAIFCKSHYRSTTFWRNIPNVSKLPVENAYLLVGDSSFQFSII